MEMEILTEKMPRVSALDVNVLKLPLLSSLILSWFGPLNGSIL